MDLEIEGLPALLQPRSLPSFVETPFVRSIVERALIYLGAGFPIHFRGAAGTGKTTLALHVATKLGRPVILVHGDEEFSTSDLVGAEHGFTVRRVLDNYIQSVLKTEEDMTNRWTDNRLTMACRYGLTLIYDEFTRSRPEANNVLLSVLQEKVLELPSARNGGGYLKVHPQFTAIFTSNPEEYAGVYRSQNALRDRMITLDLDQFDEETEVAITQTKSGIDRAEAERIVYTVRSLREAGVCEVPPTIRGCIMVAKAMTLVNGSPQRDALFRQVCLDVLGSQSCRSGNAVRVSRVREVLDDILATAPVPAGAKSWP
ncbi:MAG: gas vesicle protein GvpN [Chloroflexi bacterium]|nr:gas vesicle protein GvpN [Chloroflexota bacterium]